jgi:hypothetical protein
LRRPPKRHHRNSGNLAQFVIFPEHSPNVTAWFQHSAMFPVPETYAELYESWCSSDVWTVGYWWKTGTTETDLLSHERVTLSGLGLSLTWVWFINFKSQFLFNHPQISRSQQTA